MRRSCRSRPDGSPADLLICSASMAGIDRWHPWQVVPTSRATPTPCACARQPLVVVTSASSTLGGDARRARCAPRAISSTIAASASASVRRIALELGVEHRAVLLELGERRRRAARAPPSARARGSRRLRWCRRSWSTSACIAWSSRGELISPEYIFASTSVALAPSERASSSSFCSSCAQPSRSPVRHGETRSSSAAASASPDSSASRSGRRLGDGGAGGRARRRAPGARGAIRALRVTGRPSPSPWPRAQRAQRAGPARCRRAAAAATVGRGTGLITGALWLRPPGRVDVSTGAGSTPAPVGQRDGGLAGRAPGS